MPRLSELLEYISHPARNHIWLLLDIKLDNNADNVIRLIGETIKAAPQPERPWNRRIVMGIWAAKYLTLCEKYVPEFPISHIGFSTIYARQFLKAPNVSFNILQRVLFGYAGKRFMRDVKKAKRPLFVWTVNEDNLMRWCVHKEVDGVITDNPKRFNEIVDNWEEEKQKPVAQTWRQWFQTVWFWIMILIFSVPFRRKWPETVEGVLKLKALKEKASITRTLDT
jgi:glycerophosphoryl diester phosphodiesterase